MSQLRFFDCNASFGRCGIPAPYSYYEKDEMLRRMENYGISAALCSHALARELSPFEGNNMLMREIADEKRIFPMWVALPHHTDEFYSPDELPEVLAKNNVHALTLLPDGSAYSFSLAEWNCGELYGVLAECHVPLFLSMSSLGPDLDRLNTIMTNHPNLIVVINDVTYRVCRNLFPLLKLHKNLYVDSTGYKAMDGVTDFCNRFGAERMLFGSGMPVNSGSGAVAMITYADITDSDKALIASENLTRLLGGVKL